MRGLPNDWFRSYLTDRCQFTSLHNKNSSLQRLRCGVPQGSILGPLLFLLYINDIGNATKLHTLCFADDTTLFTSGTNINDLIDFMNFELENICTWLKENKLSLNVNKTKWMVLRPQNMHISPNSNVHIDGKDICRVSNKQSVKFLGLHMDEHLNWKNHISEIRKRLTKTLFALNLAKKILPAPALKTLYYTLIESQLNYGIIIYLFVLGVQQHEHKLIKLQ